MRYRSVFSLLSFLILHGLVNAQTVKKYKDSLVLSNSRMSVTVNMVTGKLNYRFANGTTLDNTVAYVDDIHSGRFSSADLNRHSCNTENIRDSLGDGIRINIRHTDQRRPLYLQQHITLYTGRPFLLVSAEAGRMAAQGPLPETRNISPIAILPGQNGRLSIPGNEPRILDAPFDNDDWVGIIERKWSDGPGAGTVSGISYEFSSVYDNTTMSGLVLGSVSHDFWKTGIAYRASGTKGILDSFNVFGGAATRDDPSLPLAYGGRDGTHDFEPHGTMRGKIVSSPLIYICGLKDVRSAFTGYGEVNARLNGKLTWKGYAPVYWNSFGVEGVLGYEKVMMPAGVEKIADFIHSLDNFSRYSKPVLSIDSYDQGIYTTDTLAYLSQYGKERDQQMGFYFIPFAVWTWKNAGSEHRKLAGTGYDMQEVLLKDRNGKIIPYKDGDWGAFPLDPTHPAVRQLIIGQLQKAKAIHARFLKIDFLSAGALESPSHYDPSVRSGMQAYNQGMKMLKHLIDSILGPDIFITQAISPLFPHQYAHTRFVSTDVYSHLRDDEKGFPNWGSTEASLAAGSHMWWVQGTLWPYTNLDVSIMKSFQKNPDLSEQDIKVRIYAMMAMGSILGDGSDFRQPLAAERARKFLDNPFIAGFFSHPRAFTPLQFADGDSFDQQLAFYLEADNPGANPNKENSFISSGPKDTTLTHPPLLALFNFSDKASFSKTFSLATLGLSKGKYILKDFMTDTVLGAIEKDQDSFSLTVPEKDAYLVKMTQVDH